MGRSAPYRQCILLHWPSAGFTGATTERGVKVNELIDIPKHLSSTLNESERKRHQTLSHLGYVEGTSCCSCGVPLGGVAPGIQASLLCGPMQNNCVAKYGGLPLPEAPHITVSCLLCGRQGNEAIPREKLQDFLYYCDNCMRKLESKPPGYRELTTPDKESLGVRRIA